MSGRSSSSSSMRILIAAFIVISLSPKTICNAAQQTCTPSSCGHIRNISYPFRLKGDPRHCGDSRFTLSCENNITILSISLSGEYYVRAINYHNQTIRVVDPGIDKSNCSSLPRHSLGYSMFTDPYDIYNPDVENCTGYEADAKNKRFTDASSSPPICSRTIALTFLKCGSPVNSSQSLSVVDTALCYPVESTSTSSLSWSSSASPQPKTYGYVVIGPFRVWELNEGCSIERVTFAYLSDDYDASYKSIHNSLVYGFELNYTVYSSRDSHCGGAQWRYSVRWNNVQCYPHSVGGLFRLLWAGIQVSR
ncbi:uncharacterized protein [Malus domestica]|uniref:uncharacterized protein n=1 Tax=Malus domestica TaxID=3750 RepID=UPI0039755960